MNICSLNIVKKMTNSKTELIDLQTYKPPSPRENFVNIYEPVPRKSGAVDFDIYDYDMLFNDEYVKKIIREGLTIGCFYIESPGMRSLLKKLECDTFEMLTAASSVIRPGVAESGMMQEFIARHKDPSRRKYLIPEMEKYLSETYGVMIYQEDVIKIVHHVVGLSLEEADLLRRAMSGKMRSHKAMQIIYKNFFAGCKKNGFSDKITKALWHQIESFAGYAFCKAHSASFALLSYQVAYLKVHYPAEFMASVLNNQGGYYSAAVYIWECKRIGLQVLLPCINNSNYEYDGSERTVRVGLLAVKSLNKNVIDKIVSERNENGKYLSLPEFIVRTKAGYEQTKLLIRCGAMDCFSKTRPTLLRQIDIYYNQKKILDDNYNSLFMNESILLEKEVETDVQFTLEEICLAEYETFDYMLTAHPLHFFKDLIENHKAVFANELNKHHGKWIKMVGWYMTSKRISTKKGEIMKFLSLEDLTGTFEAVIFPKIYEKYAELTMSMGPYLVEGTADTEGGNNIIVKKMSVLSADEIKSITQKESNDNRFFGDVEKPVMDEELLITSLGRENLMKAYI